MLQWFVTEKFNKNYVVIKDKEKFIEMIEEGKFEAITALAHYLREELLSRKPYTHADFDREIARLKNFVKIVKETFCLPYRDTMTFISPFKYEATLLENYISILEGFKNEIKRYRKKVRNLTVRWICDVLFKIENTHLAFETKEFMEEFYYLDSHGNLVEWKKSSVKNISLDEFKNKTSEKDEKGKN